MKDDSQGATGSRRAPYTSQACDVCRRRKIRCDGRRPVCLSCFNTKREEECSWLKESVKVPRTEAHWESMRKRNDALESYVAVLEAHLAKCKDLHGGLPEGADYLESRPELEAEPWSLEDEDTDEELAAATKNLKMEDRVLVAYGGVAPMRYETRPTRNASYMQDFSMEHHPDVTYILQGPEYVEDGIDWSRNLPLIPSLTRGAHDRILSLLLEYFTCWCMRVIPSLLLRDMGRALSVPLTAPALRTTHYSPMLHNALLALAAAFSDDPAIKNVGIRDLFARQAKELLEAETARPNIAVVQALSLLGSYHSSKGDHNLGYLYFGMSIRMGQILGLNEDCSKWVKAGIITHDDMLDRNWAHFTNYSMDVCWSLYVGRQCTVPLTLEGPQSHVPIPSSNTHYANKLSSVFSATCSLCVVVRDLMEIVNSMSNPSNHRPITYDVISKIDIQLNTWKSSLSQDVDITNSNKATSSPEKLMLHSMYWLSFILLHRPFFQRRKRFISGADKDIDHVKLCKRAADNIMDLLQIWDQRHGVRYCPVTLGQAIFSSGTVFVMLGIQAASGPKKAIHALTDALSQANLAIEFLHEVGKSWEFGDRLASILQDMRDTRLSPLLYESPRQTQSYSSLPIERVALPEMTTSASFDSTWSGSSGESWYGQQTPEYFDSSSPPFSTLFDPYAGDPLNAPLDNIAGSIFDFDPPFMGDSNYAHSL